MMRIGCYVLHILLAMRSGVTVTLCEERDHHACAAPCGAKRSAALRTARSPVCRANAPIEDQSRRRWKLAGPFSQGGAASPVGFFYVSAVENPQNCGCGPRHRSLWTVGCAPPVLAKSPDRVFGLSTRLGKRANFHFLVSSKVYMHPPTSSEVLLCG